MITVAICTFNRKEYLKKAIDSILKQTIDCNLFELLIIDNNSTDGTEELIKNNYTDNNLSIKYIKEDNQGLSYCRNTAVANSKYDFVAFLDDDGIAEPQWLELMLKVLKENNVNFACATGDVLPIWEIPKPSWLFPFFEIYFSIFQLSKERFKFTDNQNHTPAGGNVIYKKQVLIELGGFNTTLGRNGINLLSGEETLIHKKMIRNGYELIYIPDIRIHHHIHKSRINRLWLLKRSFWGGYSVQAIKKLESNGQSVINFKKLYLNLYNIILNLFLIPTGFLFKPKHYYMVYLFRFSKSLGTLYGLLYFK